MKKEKKNTRVRKTIKWSIIGAVVVLFAFTVIRYFVTYHAAEDCVSVYLYNNSEGVTVTATDWGFFVDGPGTDRAVLFYPGCKVENAAYIPFFYNLAKEGYDCLLIDVPLRHAVFDNDCGAKIMAEYDYDKWYFSGHSMGGMAVAAFAAEKADKIDGVILMGAHATKELYDKKVTVLSMYGEYDTVVNMKAVEADREGLKDNFIEYKVPGGNHAGWAYYGVQAMDTPATITQDEQQRLGIEKIISLFGK